MLTFSRFPRRATPLALALLALLAQCGADPAPADPASRLPPATQSGARTFGCLVNGQPYLPEGRVGLRSNYSVTYDPTFNGGSLSIATYQVSASKQKYLAIGGDDISRVGTYTFGANKKVYSFYTDDSQPAPCDDYNNSVGNASSKGTLTITRLDLQAGIIAGTFDYVLAQPGCDTLRLSQGRFDFRL